MDISAIAADALDLGSLVISHWAVLSFIAERRALARPMIAVYWSFRYTCNIYIYIRQSGTLRKDVRTLRKSGSYGG